MTANPLLGGAGGGGAGAGAGGGLPDAALMQNIMRSFSQGAAGSAGSRSANVERILSNPAAMQVSCCSALILSHLINILKY